MQVENQPDHLLPPEQEITEMSPGTTFRKVVDDLFTHEAVAQRLAGQEENEKVKALTEEWKQTITEHLEETALRGLNEFVDQLDYVLSQETTSEPLAADQRDELDKRVE